MRAELVSLRLELASALRQRQDDAAALRLAAQVLSTFSRPRHALTLPFTLPLTLPK